MSKLYTLKINNMKKFLTLGYIYGNSVNDFSSTSKLPLYTGNRYNNPGNFSPGVAYPPDWRNPD